MWTEYNKAEFDAILATVTADSILLSTSMDFHFKSGSTAVLTPPASTAGVHLCYAALDKKHNVVKTIWSKSS